MWATTDGLSDPFNDRADEAIAAASHILWSLSGRKYAGSRSTTEFYDVSSGIGRVYGNGTAVIPPDAVLMPPLTNNIAVCAQCGYPHRMRLRHRPVARVLSVELNGQVLAPDQYVLMDRASLGFPYGSVACYASCARVSYIWGVNPPAGGRAAALKLADQLILAWTNSDDCRLPERVTNISRQGVSWTILDPQDFLNDGRTGIYEIDLFLKSVNPDNARRPARVFSPDIPRAQTISSETAPPSIEMSGSDLAVLAAGETAWYTVPASAWPVAAHTPYAVVNGVTYGATYFTTNTDGSRTLTLSGAVTYTLTENDLFAIKADLTGPGADVSVVSGVVRFMR